LLNCFCKAIAESGFKPSQFSAVAVKFKGENMKTETGTVTVNLKDAKGQDVKFERPVSYLQLETVDDVLQVAQDPAKLKELIDAANYGFNLKARAIVNAAIKTENQGPEVAINRAVKQLVANRAKFGKVISEDDARAKVMANLEAYGIE
jgi:hypothetical protein